MAATYDWSKFTLRIGIEASQQAIYDAWTSKELIELWFLRKAETKNNKGVEKDCFAKFEEGDSYTWSWYGYDAEESGSILASNGTDAFGFSFGKAGDCYIRIYEEEGENIMELSQINIPTDERSQHEFHLGCKMGWTFYLSNLKSILEGGSDLRNKNERLTRVLNC
jgi:uncharacterized protein YndB with AHSA1/START domain